MLSPTPAPDPKGSEAFLLEMPHRSKFLTQTEDFLAQNPGAWCIGAVDVEHFRLYNEMYGAKKGTALLYALAQVLTAFQKRTGCPVSYWGNDDFYLCLPDDKAVQTHLVSALQSCIDPTQQVSCLLTLGVCPVQEHPGVNLHTLCTYARIAVVSPTQTGSLHRFVPSMFTQLTEQQQLLSELEMGIVNHEFCFFLQPKCNSVTRAIVGMEALVRWNHPTRGCLSPGVFMPLMESTGLVTQLDPYIWESVCKTLKKWQDTGSNLVPVSVNVSVVDIVNLDVPQIFSDLVEKYQLAPKLLQAEITETIVAENSAVIENLIQGLHRKGFSVLMDDFGSGYSSLNILKDTNIDAIKLDMKLIRLNPSNRRKGTQIVESVVNMAHRLDLPIIAEGVETPEQVALLQTADCLYTQGYYFFKPMPVENAEELLAQPSNAVYWDINRDLIRRDRRANAETSGEKLTSRALQAYRIFADHTLELGLLNLVTGIYNPVKQDCRLLVAAPNEPNDFQEYCQHLIERNMIHPDDTELLLAQTNLADLRNTLFHSAEPAFSRFRLRLAGQYIWVTMELLPCRNCCAQEPWATVLVRLDAQTDELSKELDFSYSHDSLTGLYNRSQFESDLVELAHGEYESMVCTYLDVLDLHEVNTHLGHRAGDSLLCAVANAARKVFPSSRIYRVGGDEFTILTPNRLPYDVWADMERLRTCLKEKDCALSVGIQYTTELCKLTETAHRAETAMQKEQQSHAAQENGARQLNRLNEKLEQMLMQKQDAEQFLSVLVPKYHTVYVVDLQTDQFRPILVADYVQPLAARSGGSFRSLLTAYREVLVRPEHQAKFDPLLDFRMVHSQLLAAGNVEIHYRKMDGANFRLRVLPYSPEAPDPHQTLWIFADEDATFSFSAKK